MRELKIAENDEWKGQQYTTDELEGVLHIFPHGCSDKIPEKAA